MLTQIHGPLARYAKLRVAHAPWMPGTFSLPPRVSDPDMHHGTCITHVPWCMPGSITSYFLKNGWRGKRSRHSRRMRNLQFYVSGKRPIAYNITMGQWFNYPTKRTLEIWTVVVVIFLFKILIKYPHIDGLVQARHNSIANTLELRLSCTNISTFRLPDRASYRLYFVSLKLGLLDHCHGWVALYPMIKCSWWRVSGLSFYGPLLCLFMPSTLPCNWRLQLSAFLSTIHTARLR